MKRGLAALKQSEKKEKGHKSNAQAAYEGDSTEQLPFLPECRAAPSFITKISKHRKPLTVESDVNTAKWHHSYHSEV